MESEHLSRLPLLQSLWVKSLQLLVFEEEEREEWKAEIGQILCTNPSSLPFHVVDTPDDSTVPSSGIKLTVYTTEEHHPSRSLCVDPRMRFMGGIPFHLVRFPEWRIDAMLDIFAIQDHEYQEYS
jgi:hypothetical protein